MSIPNEAVLAAAAAIQVRADRSIGLNDLARAALEAAAPYMQDEAYARGWGAGFRHLKGISE